MAVHSHSHSHSHRNAQASRTPSYQGHKRNPPSLHRRSPICRAMDLHLPSPTVSVQGSVSVVFSFPHNEKLTCLPGHGHRRSPRDLHNLSLTYPPASCHLYSDSLQLSIPVLKERFATCNKSFHRPQVYFGMICF